MTTLRVELPARPLTLDDLAELAAVDNGYRYELIDGNLLVMPPPDVGHARILTRLCVWFFTNSPYADLVVMTAGMRSDERSAGNPDLLVLHRPVPAGTVWIDPADVALVVEIVSAGTERLDRLIKPGQYARAGVPQFWRVERDNGPATVHMLALGLNVRGEREYVSHQQVLLDDLLAGAPPKLS